MQLGHNHQFYSDLPNTGETTTNIFTVYAMVRGSAIAVIKAVPQGVLAVLPKHFAATKHYVMVLHVPCVEMHLN